MPDLDNLQAQKHAGFLAFENLRRIGKLGIDLLFPPRCGYCGRVDTVWCEPCLAELTEQPVIQLERTLIDKLTIPVASSGWHTGILQSAIQALKYYDTAMLGQVMSQRLVALMQSSHWPIDIIVPVPLHPVRLKERGYNQSQLIAETLANIVKIPCGSDALIRHQYTESQVGMNSAQRKVNVEGAFDAKSDQIYGRNVLIIDDVLTTGATMLACAEAAHNNGANLIYGLTVTSALGS